MNKLTDTFKIKEIEFKNRIVMPPMVCFGWADESGIATSRHIEHYRKRAQGQTGAIIVEATCINENAKLRDSQIGIWSDKHLPELSKLAGVIKQYGSVALIQIHHAGFKNLDEINLSREELKGIRKDFANAAIRAMKAGFDGIELHGAHGYFISQMMSPLRNTRLDDYGGSLEKRFNFAREVIRDVQDKIHGKFLLGYRMGGNEPGIDEGMQIAGLLKSENINILHVSAGIGDANNPLNIPKDFEFSSTIWLASQIKEQVKDIPIIGVGGIKTPEQAGQVLKFGYSDFVAVGRSLLADPSWAEGIYDNKYNMKKCINCNPCGWFKDADNCPN